MSPRNRFPHLLKKNKTGFFPSQIIFFDIETQSTRISKDEEEVSMKLGYGCYLETERKKKLYKRSEWHFFEVGADLFEWIWHKLRLRRNMYLISSNIWFDLRVSELLKILLNAGFRCKNYFVKGLSQIYVFRKDDLQIIALNFQNFFRLSVKDIGDLVGRQKLAVDFKTVSEENLKKYCQEDVRIIFDAYGQWREFCETHDLGTFGKTLPSQAFNAFRHRFMTHNIFIHNSSKASQLERSSYFGGRTECFFIGKKPVQKYYYIDINSFYPYVMREYEYPTKLTYFTETGSLKQLEKCLQQGLTIAQVNITTQDPAYPVSFNYKTVFPVGTFDCFLCTEGLKRAYQRGIINRVWEIAHYDSAPIFKDYVDFFWKLRSKYCQEKKKGWEEICKMFLNTLYGKFGQMNDELLWEKECDPDLISREVLYHIDLGYTTVHTCFAGLEREVKLMVSESINSFVGISSHVTENARLLLWEYIERAGRQNVFYCDTDSLIVNEEGKRKLIPLLDPIKLGGFKIEEESSRVIIRGLKDYVFGTQDKIKGIRKDAERLDENTFRQVEFPGCLGEIRRGDLKVYLIKYVEKKLTRKYDKGEKLPSGEVKPFELNQSYGREVMEK